MGNIEITKRKLTESETHLLTETIQSAQHIVYIAPHRWNDLSACYVVEYDQKFAGVCGVSDYKQWVKIGPLVVIPTHRGKGLAKVLLERITEDYQKKHMLILSSNPIVQNIVTSMGFSIFNIIKCAHLHMVMHLFVQLISYITDLNFVMEMLRKRKTHTRSQILFYTYIR